VGTFQEKCTKKREEERGVLFLFIIVIGHNNIFAFEEINRICNKIMVH
jgi:hypothetical protein